MGPGHDMLFVLWMSSIDLNASPRLFDISLTEEHYSTGMNLTQSINIPLVQCTDQHINFNSELYKLKDKFLITNGLCPQIGQ